MFCLGQFKCTICLKAFQDCRLYIFINHAYVYKNNYMINKISLSLSLSSSPSLSQTIKRKRKEKQITNVLMIKNYFRMFSYQFCCDGLQAIVANFSAMGRASINRRLFSVDLIGFRPKFSHYKANSRPEVECKTLQITRYLVIKCHLKLNLQMKLAYAH